MINVCDRFNLMLQRFDILVVHTPLVSILPSDGEVVR